MRQMSTLHKGPSLPPEAEARMVAEGVESRVAIVLACFPDHSATSDSYVEHIGAFLNVGDRHTGALPCDRYERSHEAGTRRMRENGRHSRRSRRQIRRRV